MLGTVQQQPFWKESELVWGLGTSGCVCVCVCVCVCASCMPWTTVIGVYVIHEEVAPTTGRHFALNRVRIIPYNHSLNTSWEQSSGLLSTSE